MARYSLPAIVFHWLTVLALIGSFTMGFVMVDMAISPMKLKVYSWHKWLGVCLWGLVWLRLAWRFLVPPPPLPAGMPAWQRRAAQGTHAALYLLLLVIPLSGWLMSSAQGFTTVLFGVWPLPDLLAQNEALGERLETVHELLTRLLLVLITVHVAAAMKHHFRDRDGLLWRMVPRLRHRKPAEPASGTTHNAQGISR